mgnify:CR=1 FL=1
MTTQTASLEIDILPVVALVGRANVGKSSLFNVLTHSRAALVADQPGVTRDRQYANCTLREKQFLLVDTGGLEDKPVEGSLIASMAKQSWQAIKEAALILFIVDARAGLTSADMELAARLRKMNRKLILVINKIDGLKQTEEKINDFYSLGFSEIIPISAAHKWGIRDLEEVILENLSNDFKQIANEVKEEAIKFAIVGRPNVGKSTIVNCLLGQERVVVFNQPGTTRDSIFIPFTQANQDYVIIDTAGLRRRSRVDEAVEKFSVVKTLQAIKAADVVIAVLDAHEGITDQDLHILGLALDTWRSLIIVINKWDQLTENQKQRVNDMVDLKLSFVRYAKILYVSALKGSGIKALLPWVRKMYHNAHCKVNTAKMTQLLQEALARHAPPLSKGRRIKLRYAHLGGHSPITIVIHGTQATALPQTYQRYLADYFRQALALIGTPIRLELKNSVNPYNNLS